MKGITIHDTIEHTSGAQLLLPLAEILHLIGPHINKTTWEIKHVESVNGAADTLHQWSDTAQRIPGHTLLTVVEQVGQIIDGRFLCYHPHQSKPWLIIEAVDSAFYDVYTEDDAFLTQISQHFNHITVIPQ